MMLTAGVATMQTNVPMIMHSYYRARYYDPSIGRFISEDPVKFGSGLNHYVYGANEPVSLTDPSGETTQLAVGGPTWDNPFGHVALIINGEVFSIWTSGCSRNG